MIATNKVKLGEISTLISKGSTPRGKVNYSKTERNDFLRVTDMVDYGRVKKSELTLSDEDFAKNKMRLWPVDTVLISIEGTIGKVSILKKAMAFNQAVAGVVVDKTKILPEYLMYYLKSESAFGRIVKGTIMPAIRLGDISNLDIDLPPLDDQKKIVDTLEKIDSKIGCNNRTNDNLLELAHQIYLGKIKSKDFGTTNKLGSFCKIKYGKGLPTSKIMSQGYPVYGGNGIIGYYDEKMYDNSQVLISCRGAASGKVLFTKPECFVTNNSLVLECPEKYHFFIKEYALDRGFYDHTTGSAQPQITIDNIKDIEISVPTDDVLSHFNSVLAPMESKYFEILSENERLTKLRDTLLPELLNGKIDVSNIDI